jgi:hypothetical protein
MSEEKCHACEEFVDRRKETKEEGGREPLCHRVHSHE